MSIYKFRNFYLNTTERRVVSNGKYLELTPKTFDVIQLLVEKHGDIVTKEEILDKVWNGSFVEEGNIPVHISKLRRLLDETKDEPFIETVQGSGYRFISPVQSLSKDQWYKFLPDKNHFKADKSSEEFTLDSIAVMPLQNESNNFEIEYLADGLTESFINSLSRISKLKVIARNTVFRYKNKEVDAKEVGETLGVKTVLTGRIRLIKDRLLISIELTKVEDGTQLWGTQLNQPFSDIIEVQEKIILTVSEKLRSEIVGIGKKFPTNSATNNAESYRLYLKGKYFLAKQGLTDIYKAIEYFQKSVSHDPTNVLSYVETVECYFLLYAFDYISYTEALTKISPLLLIISGLDESFDDVQAIYGRIKMYLTWEFEEAEKHFQCALVLNPNSVRAHFLYSTFLILSGKFSEALKELQQTMSIDPLSLASYRGIGTVFYKMGQYENVIIYMKEVLELNPSDYIALALLGATLVELGNYDEALTLFQKSLSIQHNVETLSMIGYVSALAGKTDEAHKIINEIKTHTKDNYQHANKLARIYVALGKKEIAYKLLEQAFEQHEIDFIALKSDPRWISINQEPRFKELIRKVGFPVG